MEEHIGSLFLCPEGRQPAGGGDDGAGRRRAEAVGATVTAKPLFRAGEPDVRQGRVECIHHGPRPAPFIAVLAQQNTEQQHLGRPGYCTERYCSQLSNILHDLGCYGVRHGFYAVRPFPQLSTSCMLRCKNLSFTFEHV